MHALNIRFIYLWVVLNIRFIYLLNFWLFIRVQIHKFLKESDSHVFLYTCSNPVYIILDTWTTVHPNTFTYKVWIQVFWMGSELNFKSGFYSQPYFLFPSPALLLAHHWMINKTFYTFLSFQRSLRLSGICIIEVVSCSTDINWYSKTCFIWSNYLDCFRYLIPSI